MATSNIQICSNALLLLGQATINTFDEDSTGLCANLWDTCRQATLRMAHWACARKRVVLAPLVESPVGTDWTYQLQLPSDWLRTIGLGDVTAPLAHENEGRRILANDSAPLLRYVYDNTDVPSWDALLTEVTTVHMAWLMAYPITGSNTKADALASQLSSLLKLARGVNNAEAPGETWGDRPLLNSRYGDRLR